MALPIPFLEKAVPIVSENGSMYDLFIYFLNVIRDILNDIGENVIEGTVELADDEEISLVSGVAGYGHCMIGDNQEWTQFRFTSAGVVTLLNETGNVVNTDTDAKLCIYDAGANVNIKNRLAGTLNLRYSVKYNPV